MSRSRANGTRTRDSRPATPRVLVGGKYLDYSSDIVVRVLDSKRSTADNWLVFVVEAADDSRLGQRWECEERDLAALPDASAALEVERWAALFQSTKEALLRAERLPREGGGLPIDMSIAPLAAVLRRMAEELAPLSSSRKGCEGGAATTAPHLPTARGGCASAHERRLPREQGSRGQRTQGQRTRAALGRQPVFRGEPGDGSSRWAP